MPVLFANLKAGRFTFMQFTGKQDSKGTNIYEGDKIEFDAREWGSDDNVFVVEWDENNACWDFGGGSVSDMEFRTVVGHIYTDQP